LIYGIVRGLCTDQIKRPKARCYHSIENGKKGGRPKKYNDKDILDLSNQGLTHQEIADNLCCSVKTVQRALATVDSEDEI
jgi:hypothetical protein